MYVNISLHCQFLITIFVTTDLNEQEKILERKYQRNKKKDLWQVQLLIIAFFYIFVHSNPLNIYIYILNFYQIKVVKDKE